MAFILDTASAIIKDLVIDMISNRKKVIKKEEVKQRVLVFIPQDIPYDRNEVVREVMHEIDILSEQSPDLKITENIIEIRPSKGGFLKPSLEFPSASSFIERMTKIIDDRRKELKLPIGIMTDTVPVNQNTEATEKSNTPPLPLVPPTWKKVRDIQPLLLV